MLTIVSFYGHVNQSFVLRVLWICCSFHNLPIGAKKGKRFSCYLVIAIFTLAFMHCYSQVDTSLTENSDCSGKQMLTKGSHSMALEKIIVKTVETKLRSLIFVVKRRVVQIEPCIVPFFLTCPWSPEMIQTLLMLRSTGFQYLMIPSSAN